MTCPQWIDDSRVQPLPAPSCTWCIEDGGDADGRQVSTRPTLHLHDLPQTSWRTVQEFLAPTAYNLGSLMRQLQDRFSQCLRADADATSGFQRTPVSRQQREQRQRLWEEACALETSAMAFSFLKCVDRWGMKETVRVNPHQLAYALSLSCASEFFSLQMPGLYAITPEAAVHAVTAWAAVRWFTVGAGYVDWRSVWAMQPLTITNDALSLLVESPPGFQAAMKWDLGVLVVPADMSDRRIRIRGVRIYTPKDELSGAMGRPIRWVQLSVPSAQGRTAQETYGRRGKYVDLSHMRRILEWPTTMLHGGLSQDPWTEHVGVSGGLLPEDIQAAVEESA